MRLFGASIALVVFLGSAAAAEERPRLELEAGAGSAFGGGIEDPAPSLGTISFGATFWISESWGIAGVYVASYGEDRYDPPIDSLDRIFHGQDDLRYLRIGARYRRPLRAGWILNVGAGLVRHASFETVMLRKTPDGLVRIDGATYWGGGSGELYVSRAISGRLAVRAGATLDTGTETTVFHPVVLGVVSF